MDQLKKGLDKAEQITDRLRDRYEEIAKGTALRDREMENTKHRDIRANIYPRGKPGGTNKEDEKEAAMFEEIKTVCFPQWMKKSPLIH